MTIYFMGGSHFPFDFATAASIGVVTESQPDKPAAAPTPAAVGALGGGSSAVLLAIRGPTHDPEPH